MAQTNGGGPGGRWWLGLVGALALAGPVRGLDYTFSTFAGTPGRPGATDGSGGAALFRTPGAVAVSGMTNLFVADTGNYTIRKLTAAGGVTTFAGAAGAAGSANGVGANARFSNMYGLAVDGTGNVLVADTFNHTIRRITPAGSVTTLAGVAGVAGSADGTGANARFNTPCGVAIDAANNLLVADYNNHTIRKVTPAGVVTTVAGAAGAVGSADGLGGSARFWHPRSVAVDGAGNVWVADYETQTIRKISPARAVTTLAGFTEPLWKWVKHGYAEEDAFRDAALRSLVARGAGSIFYVLQNSAEDFHLWLDGNVVLGMYMLGTPSPVDGHRTDDFVKRCNSLGIATQVPVLFNSPDDFAGQFASHDAYLRWFAQSIAWAPSGQFVVCLSHHTHLNGQVSAGWTPDYVNQLAAKLKQYTGGRFKVAVHDNYPQCLTWGRGSSVDLIYVDRENRSDADVAAVLADVRKQTGKAAEARTTSTADGVGGGAQFTAPIGLATDAAGNVVVVDAGDHCVRMVTPGGVVTTLAGSPGNAGSADGTGGAARFRGLNGVCVDLGNKVYVADGGNHTLRLGLFDIRGAVNAPALAFTSGGAVNWFAQTAVTHDGTAAARSGPIGNGQQSWMQTTVTGPGSLSFWWKSSSAPANTLQLLVNSQLVTQVSGNADWNQYITFLGATNTCTLQWAYLKNTAAVAGSDAAFVDQVTWVPCAYAAHVPQLFYQDPASGILASWVLNSDGTQRFSRLLGSTPGWVLKAAGDVDGDGVSDLIFQTPAGLTAVWFLSADGSLRGSKLLGDVGPTWEVRACGDFLNRGRAQLFFQAGGTVAYWLLDASGTYQSAAICGTGLGTWKLCAAGDLDHDNKAELFFMAGGMLAIWLHDGTNGAIRGITAYTQMGTWQVHGAMDIDGDGVSDLVWQDPAGSTAGWFMNPNGKQRGAPIIWGNLGPWKLKAAGR